MPTSFSSFPFNWNQYRNIISICVYILYFLMFFKAIFLFNEDTNFNHVHSLHLHLSISSPTSSSLSLNRKIYTGQDFLNEQSQQYNIYVICICYICMHMTYIHIYMQLLSPPDWIPQYSQSYADVGMVAGEPLVHTIECKKRKVGICWQLLWKWHFEALSSRKWGSVRHEAKLFSLITFLVRPPEGTAHSPW